jgi:hypothetical protein
MPFYEIKFWRSLYGECTVEAASEEAAKNKFDNDGLAYMEEHESCGDDLEIKSVEEIPGT